MNGTFIDVLLGVFLTAGPMPAIAAEVDQTSQAVLRLDHVVASVITDLNFPEAQLNLPLLNAYVSRFQDPLPKPTLHGALSWIHRSPAQPVQDLDRLPLLERYNKVLGLQTALAGWSARHVLKAEKGGLTELGNQLMSGGLSDLANAAAIVGLSKPALAESAISRKIFDSAESMAAETGINIRDIDMVNAIPVEREINGVVKPSMHQASRVSINGQSYAYRILENYHGFYTTIHLLSFGQFEVMANHFINAHPEFFPDFRGSEVFAVHENNRTHALEPWMDALPDEDGGNFLKLLPRRVRAESIVAGIVFGTEEEIGGKPDIALVTLERGLILRDHELSGQSLDLEKIARYVKDAGLTAEDMRTQLPLVNWIINDNHFVEDHAAQFQALGVPADKAREFAGTIQKNALVLRIYIATSAGSK